jgi:hypothetical protein
MNPCLAVMTINKKFSYFRLQIERVFFGSTSPSQLIRIWRALQANPFFRNHYPSRSKCKVRPTSLFLGSVWGSVIRIVLLSWDGGGGDLRIHIPNPRYSWQKFITIFLTWIGNGKHWISEHFLFPCLTHPFIFSVLAS